MSNCTNIQSLLSEYQENSGMSPAERAVVAAHLASCPECVEFSDTLKQTVALIQNVPMPEPTIDLWQEFEPKMVEIEVESHLAPIARTRRIWQRFVAHLAEGMVLYTHVVAHRTLTSMERYLIRDPFGIGE